MAKWGDKISYGLSLETALWLSLRLRGLQMESCGGQLVIDGTLSMNACDPL